MKSRSEKPSISQITAIYATGHFLFGKLGIEKGEYRLVLFGALALTMVGWADISIQNAAETLFLKRVGVEYLPIVFLASSLLLVLSTSFMGWFVAKRWRRHFLPATIFVLALSVVPFWYMVHYQVFGSVVLTMVFLEQLKAISLLVFWVAIGKMLTARQAKRLFAPLFAGLTAGMIFGSFVSEPISRFLGIEGLIGLGAISMTLGAYFAFMMQGSGAASLEKELQGKEIGKGRPKETKSEKVDRKEKFKFLSKLWQTNVLFRLLLIATVCYGLLAPMLYFQFSYVADQATSGSGGEQKLLALYSQLRGWMYLCVLTIQICFASRIYRLIGVPLAVAISPALYLGGFLAISFFMNLVAAIAAIALAQVQDKSIYSPGIRILYNLFPEEIRSAAIAILDGPAMRVGSTLGNILILAVLAYGSARYVGYFAVPAALVWLVAGVVLWKQYPSLLLSATSKKKRVSDVYEDVGTLFDPGTLNSLKDKVKVHDLNTCKASIALLEEAPAVVACEAYVEASAEASAITRPLLLKGLDQVLERCRTKDVNSEIAANQLVDLLKKPDLLSKKEKIITIQAYGRLIDQQKLPEKNEPIIESALDDESECIKLAAITALYRLGDQLDEFPSLDQVLESAVENKDFLTRQTARRELRTLLLDDQDEQLQSHRLKLLAKLLYYFDDRARCADAIAQIALINSSVASSVVCDEMLALKDDPNPSVREAVIAFIGNTGLRTQASWLVERLASPDLAEAEAAREALLLLGPQVTNALMIEYSFGKRKTRDAVLSIIKEFRVEPEKLEDIFSLELECLTLMVERLTLIEECIDGGNKQRYSLLTKRFEEQIEEGVYTALLLISARKDHDKIAELADLLRLTDTAQERAILIEALESLLNSREKARLIPILERKPADLQSEKKEISKELTAHLLEDSDEHTKEIARVVFEEESEKSSLIKRAQTLQEIPLFSNLSVRQLIDLAEVAKEISYSNDESIIEENEVGRSLFLIVEGKVEVCKGDTKLSALTKGEFFGEMAVFEKVKRSASIKAVGEVTVLQVAGEELLDLIEEEPGIAIAICKNLSQRLNQLNSRIEQAEASVKQ